jgi:hypothetical protein
VLSVLGVIHKPCGGLHPVAIQFSSRMALNWSISQCGCSYVSRSSHNPFPPRSGVTVFKGQLGDWDGQMDVCPPPVSARRATRPKGEWGCSTRCHMLGRECPEAVLPDRAFYLPPFIHFQLIVNILLSHTLSLSPPVRLQLLLMPAHAQLPVSLFSPAAFSPASNPPHFLWSRFQHPRPSV